MVCLFFFWWEIKTKLSTSFVFAFNFFRKKVRRATKLVSLLLKTETLRKNGIGLRQLEKVQLLWPTQ
jgi:hypothetical protein